MTWEHSYSQPTGSRDCGAFFLDVVGAFAPDRVAVRWADQPRASNDHVERIVEKTWREQTRRAAEGGQRLFDGPLCRLVHFHEQDHALTLALGPVSFREFLGTNATHAYLRYVHGPEVLADPVGVSANLATADGFLLLGRRSRRVLRYAGRIHPVGGMVEPGPADPPAPDVFASICDEIAQETGLAGEALAGKTLLGLVRDKHTVQPELIFDVAVEADVADILRVSVSADDAEEHAEWIPLRNHPATAVTFIEQHFSELTPVALAALLLHGLRHWGTGWFAAARGYLRSVI